MSKVSNLIMRHANGKLAGTTFYGNQGATIVREVNDNPKNPQTRAQMLQRIKLGAVVNMWRCFANNLTGFIPLKSPLQTDFNAFVSLVLPKTSYCLSKDEVKSNFLPCPSVKALEHDGSLYFMLGLFVDEDGVGFYWRDDSKNLQSLTIGDMCQSMAQNADGKFSLNFGDRVVLGVAHVGLMAERTEAKSFVFDPSSQEKVLDVFPNAWTEPDGNISLFKDDAGSIIILAGVRFSTGKKYFSLDTHFATPVWTNYMLPVHADEAIASYTEVKEDPFLATEN